MTQKGKHALHTLYVLRKIFFFKERSKKSGNTIPRNNDFYAFYDKLRSNASRILV